MVEVLAESWPSEASLVVELAFSPASDKVCKSECDIREHFDTNECPNTIQYVSTKLHE